MRASTLHATEAVVPMDPDIIATQPLAVSMCVEDTIKSSGWYFRAKQASRLGSLPPGWMQPAMFERLHALDVPVSRLFTLCAQRWSADVAFAEDALRSALRRVTDADNHP